MMAGAAKGEAADEINEGGAYPIQGLLHRLLALRSLFPGNLLECGSETNDDLMDCFDGHDRHQEHGNSLLDVSPAIAAVDETDNEAEGDP